MRLFLSGPMSGVRDWNHAAFKSATELLRSKGWEVWNPAEIDAGDTTKPRSYYVRKNLEALLECDALAVLPGWQLSAGAIEEIMNAASLGMPVYELEYILALEKQIESETWMLGKLDVRDLFEQFGPTTDD